MKQSITNQSRESLLAQTLHLLNLQVSEETQHKLLAYLDLLNYWSKAYNLTAIHDPEESIIKHIGDSLSVTPYLSEGNWLDVGSGGGLPGVPLALTFPRLKWTLLDSNGKKTRFLIQAKATLGIDNIEVINSRVETFKPVKCFDNIIARAWTNLNDMVHKTKHLCCPGGHLWAMKGVYPEEELKLLTYPFEVYRLAVPNLPDERHLVRIEL